MQALVPGATTLLIETCAVRGTKTLYTNPQILQAKRKRHITFTLLIAFSLLTGAQNLADISCALGHSKQNSRPQ
jgi:hypothetical protein